MSLDTTLNGGAGLPDDTNVDKRAHRGLLDFLLMLALGYAVYAMTPIGALGEYAFRAAMGQKQRPNLFATFRGHDTHVELGKVDFDKGMLSSKRFPPSVIAASEKTGVNKELLVTLLISFGKCEGDVCTLAKPPFLEQALDDLSLDDDVSVEHLAWGIAKLGDQLAKAAGKSVKEELAVEALYAGPFVVERALDRARATGLKTPEDVEVHAPLLPPGVRRGKLQPALQVLAMHRLRTLAWPADKKWRISSPFGERIHPVLGTRRFHNGTDLATPTGTPLLSAHRGRVSRAGRDAVSGNYLKIDHGFGIETTYCHMSVVDKDKGDRVDRSEKVGKSGATGRITGPHLHYILRLQGKPVDAEQYGAAPTRRSGGAGLELKFDDDNKATGNDKTKKGEGKGKGKKDGGKSKPNSKGAKGSKKASSTTKAKPQTETPKAEPAKTETPKAETPKAESSTPSTDAPEAEAETPKAESAAPSTEAPEAETPSAAEPKAETPSAAEPKAETPSAAEPKAEAPKAESATRTPKSETPATPPVH